MAISLVTNNSGRVSGGDVTIALTVPGGLTNSAILVLTSAQDGNLANLPVGGATWNTTENFTKIREDVGGVGHNVSSGGWILLNPTAGSLNVVVDFNGSIGECAAFAFVIDHAYQSTTADANNGVESSGQSPSLALTTITNNAWVFGVISTEATISGVGSGQTMYGPLTDQSFENAAGSKRGPVVVAGSSTQSFTTGSGQSYAITIFAIAPDSQPAQPSFRSNINGGVNIRPRAFGPGIAR